MEIEKDLLKTIGSNIRFARHEKGYSQESFAQHIAMDRSYLGCIERGERNIASLNLIRIAKGLVVQVGDLFKGI